MRYDLVIPTAGRGALSELLEALASGIGPWPERIVLVDDRRAAAADLNVRVPASLRHRLVTIRSGGRGPAAARNAGAGQAAAGWIAFLDDDVIPEPGWRAALVQDIREAGDAAATQGRVKVRDPDPDRTVKGLETGVWITADMAYRRDIFIQAGGFDERFPRPYREDSDLGLRLTAAGLRIAHGRRRVMHPVKRSAWWSAVTRQRGNADDALMLFLHGRGWQERAGAPRGIRTRHLATVGLFVTALTASIAGRRRLAAAAFGGWLAMTAILVRERRSLATSVAIPFAASGWWAFGLVAAWRLTHRPRAVLFDRDGTLVEDVPYNGAPGGVRLRPGARAALDRLRASGIRVGMVSNQSGLARGLITHSQVEAVNRRVEELLGPFDAMLVCPHGPNENCECRKPKPGLVLGAARRLRLRPSQCAVIGDIESDITAASRAGARGVMVPTPSTLPAEVARAREVASSLEQAVNRLLGPPK